LGEKKMNTQVMFSSQTDNWSTPQWLFDDLHKEFDFTLDSCASTENAKCEKYYTREQDGLKQNWGGQRVFCNPPYGREIGKWVTKCSEEAKKPNTLCVMLVPARTDTKWFHEYIYNKAEIRFLRGRLKFGGSTNSAPFPSMIAIFKNRIDWIINPEKIKK
jgi:site-specific DNA-methyltransferase (adenine-specific)